MKSSNTTCGCIPQCRILKRCFLFFATISILPFGLIYMLSTNDGSYRISKHYEIENDTFESHTHRMAQKSFPPEMEERIEERMNLRSSRLAEKCSYYGLDVHAASTSWMYNFNVLAGYSPEFLKKTKLVPLNLARKKYPRPSVDELIEAQNGSITFLIVRHPFERLLSAYRDKLQFALPHTFHAALGQKIIRKYREKKYQLKPGKYAIRWPTFGEFAEFLIHEYKAKKELDMHWTPITTFCTPCQVKFDIIAKFETLDEDQQYLIHKASLSHLISPQWKNSGKGKNTADLLKKYYSTLTQRQIREIYEIFKYDFELFGYDPQPYFEMAQADYSTVDSAD
uniref:Carbohydrate sulfotransferase n=1 Tax=Culicoides sonorensis TaxID=179676 RepID=A0A336LZ33_CULSO